MDEMIEPRPLSKVWPIVSKNNNNKEENMQKRLKYIEDLLERSNMDNQSSREKQ